jgi:hypothetical protein
VGGKRNREEVLRGIVWDSIAGRRGRRGGLDGGTGESKFEREQRKDNAELRRVAEMKELFGAQRKA